MGEWSLASPGAERAVGREVIGEVIVNLVATDLPAVSSTVCVRLVGRCCDDESEDTCRNVTAPK